MSWLWSHEKREEKELKETQTLSYIKANHPSKTCRVPTVWRGGDETKKTLWQDKQTSKPSRMYVTYFVLPSTPFMRWLGGDTEYPLAGLPIKLVLGEYSPLLSLRRRSREAAWIFPPEPWWHLMIWGSRLSHFMIIPITKRHPNNTNTDQLPIPEVITGFPRPYHNTWALNVTRIHTFLAARTILVLVLLPNG